MKKQYSWKSVAISSTFNQQILILFRMCLKHPGGMEVVQAQPAAATYAERWLQFVRHDTKSTWNSTRHLLIIQRALPKPPSAQLFLFSPPLEGTLPLDSLYTFFFHRFLCLLTTHRHCWSLQKELNILRLYYSRKHSKSATYKAVYKMLAAVSSTINITINILQFFALRHINSVSWSGFWFK